MNIIRFVLKLVMLIFLDRGIAHNGCRRDKKSKNIGLLCLVSSKKYEQENYKGTCRQGEDFFIR